MLVQETFGDRLKALRKTCDLNAVEMAKILGVARPTYQTWEGDTLPRDLVDVATRVVNEFGVCRDWLIWGSCTHDTHEAPTWKGRSRTGSFLTSQCVGAAA